MSRRRSRDLIGAVLLALAGPLAAQQGDSSESSGLLAYRNRLIELPYATYAPQTKIQFGVAGGYQFKPGGAGSDQATRASYVAANLAYTTKGQWITFLEGSVYPPGKGWWLCGRVNIAFFPLFYYGIGPRADPADTNLMEHRFIKLEGKLVRRLTGDVYFGPYYRLHSYFDLEWQFPERLPGGLPGGEGGVNSGAGFSLVLDSRNSTTTPSQGRYLLVDYLHHAEWLGSDFTYDLLVLDGRSYLPLRDGKDVLAAQLYGQFDGAEIPIQSMPGLSSYTSAFIGRGVYQGRFRDRHQLVGQVDYRGHLKGRFGYVVFGSAGNVFGSLGNQLFDAVQISYGGGLRFNVNPVDPLNLRVDYTFTSFGESGLSIGAAEAF